jgi:uncharacterized protein YndB with AHSA1/START domain
MARAQRLIDTTPEAAFTYLSDVTRHDEWAGDSKLEVDQTSPGAVMVGATFERRGRQFGVKFEDEVKIVEFRPPERFAFDSTSNAGTFRHSFEFEPLNGKTRIVKEQRSVPLPQGFSPGRMVMELIRSQRLAGDLRRIAGQLEKKR